MPEWKPREVKSADPFPTQYVAKLTDRFELRLAKTYANTYAAYLMDCGEPPKTVWQPHAFKARNDKSACDSAAAQLFEYLFQKQEVLNQLVAKAAELGGVKLCKNTAEQPRTTWTAFKYESDGVTTKDLHTWDTREEAVTEAVKLNWDEVVNDATGEVVWRNNELD